MSRELLLALDAADVIARCNADNIEISALEPLTSGGVRLVCSSSTGAAVLGRKLKRHLIEGKVTRERHRPTNPLW